MRIAVELWRQLAAEDTTPARIAEAVNRELYQDNRERMFVTLFLGFLDTRTGVLAYTNAGHPAPHVLRASGDIERVDGKTEAPLGVQRDTAYQRHSVTLQPGDAVFVCTDGVIEAMNAADEFYTRERLDADLCAARTATPEEMVRAVKEHVNAFTGSVPKADDVTMLALRWLPAPG